MVKGIKIEIGGSSKNSKNADIVLSDEIGLPVKIRFLIYFVGLLF